MSRYVLISVGAMTPTFDDLTISFHNDDVPETFVGWISGDDLKSILREISTVLGTDNGLMYRIELRPPTGFENRAELLSELKKESIP